MQPALEASNPAVVILGLLTVLVAMVLVSIAATVVSAPMTCPAPSSGCWARRPAARPGQPPMDLPGEFAAAGACQVHAVTVEPGDR